MTTHKFATLPATEKKKIIKAIVRDANKEQKELMEKYKELKAK